jgi:hypothetical protein
MGQKLPDALGALDYNAARAMLDRVQQAAFSLGGSQTDWKLSRKLTPPEHAGAHILRSIDVLLKAGLSMDEIEECHAEMVLASIMIRREQME